MNRIKNIISLALFSIVLSVPMASVAHADQNYNNNKGSRLVCKTPQIIYSEIQNNSDNNNNYTYTTENCDLNLIKEVSVDGGNTFVQDTSANAPTVHLGDKVVWRVTVSDNSASNNTPFGKITVSDVLPSGLTQVGSAVTSPTSSTYAANAWKFTIPADIKTNPATLTITTTANTIGQIENDAAITDYSQDRDENANCCYNSDQLQVLQVKKLTYCDSVNTNNSASAYVNVIADPVVTTPVTTPTASTTPSAPNTGFGVMSSTPVLALSALSLGSVGLLGLARTARRFTN